MIRIRVMPWMGAVAIAAAVSMLSSVPAIAAGSASKPASKPVAKKAVAAAHASSGRAQSRTTPVAGRQAATRQQAKAGREASADNAGGRRVRMVIPSQSGDSRAVVRHLRGSGRTLKVSLNPRIVAPSRPSIGQAIGLHDVDDPLDLRSSVALVVDQQTGEILFSKNAHAVLPIASITKLMTSMVVLDANLPPSELLEVTEADIDTERHSRSRLRVGTRLSRAELMNLALMSSENRAANALGRHYPGGLTAFVAAMNAKARALGMMDSYFVDPTGLSSRNVSNAQDLARMVRAASGYREIRHYSTSTELLVDLGVRPVAFHNTNRLIDAPDWEIGLSKTGFINEAGNCLVMQSRIEGRPVIMVLLDATARAYRFSDAQRIKHWLENLPQILPAAPGKLTRTLDPIGS